MSTSAIQPELASVLLIGVDVDARAGQRAPESAADLATELTANWSRADTGRAALELMRVTHFDLILVPPRLTDMSVWHLLGAVRSAWPWQKWALVADECTDARDEVRARTLGVMRIFDDLPSVADVLHVARAAAASRRPPAVLRQAVGAPVVRTHDRDWSDEPCGTPLTHPLQSGRRVVRREVLHKSNE